MSRLDWPSVLFWLYAPIEIDGKSLSDILYEIVPGFVLSGVAAIVVSIVGRDVLPHVLHRFGEMEKAMEEGSK